MRLRWPRVPGLRRPGLRVPLWHRRRHRPDLSDAERLEIAKIRKELDAEFDAELAYLGVDVSAEDLRAAGATSPSQATEDISMLRRPFGADAVRHRLIVTALIGALTGAVTGGVAMSLWWRQALDLTARPFVPVSVESQEATERAGAPPSSLGGVPSVEHALHRWIEAHKHADIAAQMDFYPARVPVYYTWRDVPSAVVCAEKLKVFGGATVIIATDTPTIALADDGATAISRFRKLYVIEGPVVRRRGEVLQELRWRRTPEGWLIIAERDARVLAPDI